MDPIQALSDPYCHGMQEHPSALIGRAKLAALDSESRNNASASDPLSLHVSLGFAFCISSNWPIGDLFKIVFTRLAYTIGSAIGSIPPSSDSCLAAFVLPNSVGLTAGARAWSKHAHRSQPQAMSEDEQRTVESSTGWWGTPSGPVAVINERALALFWKVMNAATWKNLHWLPHQVLVYEVRVAEGYGMRWSQDQSGMQTDGDRFQTHDWTFRGFVEPMMEGGHEVGWRH